MRRTGATIMRGNALQIPLADESVDLVVTSPPYFALRSYRDADGHYDGQVGSEASPEEFLEALWAVTDEVGRVLTKEGSAFFDYGDKYAGSGGHNNNGLTRSLPEAGARYANGEGHVRAARRNGPDRYIQESGGIRDKSLMGLPWRFAIGCIEPRYRQLTAQPKPDPLYPDSILEEGWDLPDDRWILRAELVWFKLNGMPESVGDRVRRNHEQFFHLTKNGEYYSAIDEIREDHAESSRKRAAPHRADPGRAAREGATVEGLDMPPQTMRLDQMNNSKGRLPGSVWEIATEPLKVPDWLEVDHYAAFPQEWPRRLILGWSPPGICLECHKGRFPVTEPTGEEGRHPGGGGTYRDMRLPGEKDTNLADAALRPRRIIGYACACTPRTSNRGTRGDWKNQRNEEPEKHSDDWHSPGNSVPRRPGGFGTTVPEPEAPLWTYHFEQWTPAPTRPAVVLDPFGGTGTVAMVARALGRYGVSLDLSGDYCRLARWRVFDSGHAMKTHRRTNAERQGTLL